jgi:hypothetical protein
LRSNAGLGSLSNTTLPSNALPHRAAMLLKKLSWVGIETKGAGLTTVAANKGKLSKKLKKTAIIVADFIKIGTYSLIVELRLFHLR